MQSNFNLRPYALAFLKFISNLPQTKVYLYTRTLPIRALKRFIERNNFQNIEAVSKNDSQHWENDNLKITNDRYIIISRSQGLDYTEHS